MQYSKLSKIIVNVFYLLKDFALQCKKYWRKSGANNKRKKHFNYKKPEEKGFWSLVKKAFKWGFFSLATVFIAALLFLGYVYFFIVPKAKELPNRMNGGTTVVYDRTGEHILYEIHDEENRKTISHDQIPDTIKTATIVAEDASFYKHFGIDLSSIIRAMLINFKNKDFSQGASTITQQLARNVFLDREKTFKRKFLEMLIAVKLERKFTKDEILDFYLNQIPYGSNTYGIQSAAETFFGKDAGALTLDEAALLAVLPKATTFYSPYGNNREALVTRQKMIIRQMEALEVIDKKTADATLAIDTMKKILPLRINIEAPHFVFYVKEILEKQYGAEALENGGFKIYTTLDYDMQKRAEETIRQGMENSVRYNASNGALVAVNPKNGELLAMVGSKDYFNQTIDGQVNVAVRLRQPGSSFKPFAYAKAFEKGYQPETMIYDAETDFGPDGTGKNYIPHNYDGQFRGLLSMRQALAGSLNIPAVKTLYLAGIDETIDLAHRLGITTLNDRSRYGLSLVLGGGEVKLVDMAYAFSVFANDGLRAEPTAILKIVDSKNNIVMEHSVQSNQIIDKQIARKINSILSDNFARAATFGSASPLAFKDRAVAAKTGTTQEFRDAWTIGFTPSIAVGVWVGNNDSSFMKQGADGIYVAAPIWRNFMDKELAFLPKEEFVSYEKVISNKPMITGSVPGEIRYYKIKSGKKISQDDLKKYKADEVRQQIDPDKHSILYYVNKDFPLSSAPPDYYDPMLWRWEKALGQETENTFLDGGLNLNFVKNSDKDSGD